ncbi:MAG: hypothetical protein DMF24_04810 [Verrucomicrobia bacterium]|nr:MAG: hypothetical protein DMF24_04810 [Verrucomicrobiota bacterium]
MRFHRVEPAGAGAKLHGKPESVSELARAKSNDFLITPPFADKSRNFLFAPGEPDEMRQTGARCRPRR